MYSTCNATSLAENSILCYWELNSRAPKRKGLQKLTLVQKCCIIKITIFYNSKLLIVLLDY